MIDLANAVSQGIWEYKLQSGVIVAIVVGAILLLVGIVALIVWIYFKIKDLKDKKKEKEQGENKNE